METTLEIVVRPTEIDVNGHVNNAKYVEYLEWGREEWYESNGLPYERLLIALNAVASAEQALTITIKYVKERTAFGKPLMDLQHTRFTLAECRTQSHIGRVFIDHCIQKSLAGTPNSRAAQVTNLPPSTSEATSKVAPPTSFPRSYADRLSSEKAL